jgi:hypothetical protein
MINKGILYMKKFFIVITFFVMTLFATDLKAWCPPDFVPGTPVSIFLCGPNCRVDIEWCHRARVGRPDDVFISEYHIVGDGCDCFAQDQYGNQAPSLSDMITGIVQQEGHEIGIPNPLVNLPPCDEVTPGNDIQMHVYIGACYYIYYQVLNDIRYKACQPLVMGECRSYYRICLEQDANQNWYVNVEGLGNPTIMFNCTNPCFPLCN